MRVVVDANVVLTAAFDITSVPSLLAYERERLAQLIPTTGWQEVRSVAHRSARRTGVDPAAVDQVLELYRTTVGLQLVPTRSPEGTTAYGPDAHYEAVARWEGADAICTYDEDLRDSLMPPLTPLAVLRELDFEKYCIPIWPLNRDEGCLFAELRWQSTAGFPNAWLLSDPGGRRFGIDREGHWVWNTDELVSQVAPLQARVTTKLLVGWNENELIVWTAVGEHGFVEQARSGATLRKPTSVEFVFAGPGNGWRCELFGASAAPVFPSGKDSRRRIRREGVVDTMFSSRLDEELIRGTFQIDGPDGHRILKFEHDGHRRPFFGHLPSKPPDQNLQNFTWTSLIPGLEALDFKDHSAGQRFIYQDGQWWRLF